ncbi:MULTISPECIES: hypothetical protein [Prevotella]|uniref:hypothetical protein n=1 Tax=Prevotella TaxID=838 RepID=UPI0003AD6D62|nr:MULTISPECIES: hypothetical protein [Prevotella]ERJ80054.1 hypothetical protein HMPREF9148_00140 [Prevotella sp. F0091]
MTKKIMFNDKYCLTQVVLNGTKTMTRRVLKKDIPLGNWEETKKYLPYKGGEVIAIAQPYKDIIECMAEYNDIIINVDGSINREFQAGWKNKMFVRADLMPHHIKITDVRIERLQDISDEDIMREGVWQFYDNKDLFYVSKNIGDAHTVAFPSACEAFVYLIDKVSGKGTWESNPWVVAYIFELVD